MDAAHPAAQRRESSGSKSNYSVPECPAQQEMGMTSFSRSWKYRPKTKSMAACRRKLKKIARRKARRGDGIVRHNDRDVL